MCADTKKKSCPRPQKIPAIYTIVTKNQRGVHFECVRCVHMPLYVKYMSVCVKPSVTTSGMMRWHDGGKLSHPLPSWESVCPGVQFFFVSWLLGGYPRLILYLKSCSNFAWETMLDRAFLYYRAGSGG